MKNIFLYHQISDEIDEKIDSCIDKVEEVEFYTFDSSDSFEKIIRELSSMEDFPQLVFIPTMYGQNNCAAYKGVELALRWYFYLVSSNKISNSAIVLLGTESEGAFYRHCDYSFFLKCPNVYYRYNHIRSIKEFINGYTLKYTSVKDCISTIKKIGIKPPSSYKTHHSITNEWSIYRWSKFLGIHDDILSILDKEISNSLYYQYLQTIYPIQDIDKSQKAVINQGRVLLIDDESAKGWNLFFKSLLLCQNFKSNFKSIGEDFKQLSAEEIINKSIEVVEQFNPDVVILDLRLCDEDFDNKKPEEITGVRILKQIKEKINKGIQVIMFSASNKIWNYIELQKIGIDGIIIKESPEQSIEKNFTKESVSNLKNEIEQGLSKSKYLKSTFLTIQEYKNEIKNTSPFKESIIKQLELSYFLLYSAKIKEQFAYAYVSLYMIIELINKEFTSKNIEGKWAVKGSENEYIKNWNWNYDEKKYSPFSKNQDGDQNEFAIGDKASEWKKIAGLFLQKWGGNVYNREDNEFVKELYYAIKKRNHFIHKDKEFFEKDELNNDIFKSEGFVSLFKLVKKILNFIIAN